MKACLVTVNMETEEFNSIDFFTEGNPILSCRELKSAISGENLTNLHASIIADKEARKVWADYATKELTENGRLV